MTAAEKKQPKPLTSVGAKKTAVSVAEVIPDLTYIIGTTKIALAEFKAKKFSPKVNASFAVGWNYIDAACSIMSGINLLLDEDNHHRSQNKAKGLINIISGVQSFVLSYNTAFMASATGLAGPAFAFGTLCDLINASIDFYNADKEMCFEGWLEERINEIKHIEERLADPLMHHNVLEMIEKKIELEKKHADLTAQVEARCRVYCHDERKRDKENVPINLDDRKKFVKDRLDSIKSIKIENCISYANFPDAVQQKQKDKLIDENIRIQLKKEYQSKKMKLLAKTASFLGMTALAIASLLFPPLGFAATITSLIAATYYLYQNAKKVAVVKKQPSNDPRLFHEKKSEPISPAQPDHLLEKKSR